MAGRRRRRRWCDRPGAAAGQDLGSEELSKEDPFAETGEGAYSTGRGSDETVRMEELFPDDADRVDIDEQEDYYGGDEDRLLQDGREHAGALRDDESTPEGEAQAVVRESSEQSTPDFERSPLGEAARDAYGNSDLISGSFAGCTTETGVTERERSEHLSDYNECVRATDRTKSCELEHEYGGSIVESHSGPWNTKPCGRGCQLLWIGEVGDNYWSGRCEVYSKRTEFEITHPEAIESVELVRAKFDDYMKVAVGEPGKSFDTVWQGPHGNNFPTIPDGTTDGYGSDVDPTTANVQLASGAVFDYDAQARYPVGRSGRSVDYESGPLLDLIRDSDVPVSDIQVYREASRPGASGGWTSISGVRDYEEPGTGGKCELSTSWDKSPGVDLTSRFRRLDPNDVLAFQIKASVSGGGEAYARLKIEYDPAKAIDVDKWSPSDCVEAVQGIDDGAATGEVSCQSKPETDDSGCAVLNGFTICPSDLREAPVSRLDRVCKEAHVDVTYPAAGGDGEDIDACETYEDDPDCGFVSSRCRHEGRDTGECYQRIEKWDCGGSVSWDEHVAETEYDCGGSVRCMGDDCASPSRERSGSFEKAATLLEAADYMMMDANCSTSADTKEDIDLEDCKIFAGEAGECKVALDGYKDCCDGPGGGVSLQDYMAMLKATQKLDQASGITDAILETQGGKALKGAWETLAGKADNVWSNVTEPFSSAFNSIAGNTAEDASTEIFADGIKQSLTDATAEWVGKTFGAAARDALFTQAGSGAGQYQLGGSGAWAGNIISGAMTAYMVYVIAKAVIDYVYRCEEDEMELAAKRELRSCTKVGEYCSDEIDVGFDEVCVEEQKAYCCFNSPLSRIMQEQIREQMGDMSWGSATSPNCSGINPRRLDEIDWDEVDLSEWTAILASTGHLPEPSDLDIESLTGDGSFLADGTDGDRANSAERSDERADEVGIGGTHEQATDELEGMYPPERGSGGDD